MKFMHLSEVRFWSSARYVDFFSSFCLLSFAFQIVSDRSVVTWTKYLMLDVAKALVDVSFA